MQQVKKSENDLKKECLGAYIKLLKKEKALDEEIREIQLNKTHPAFSCDGMPKGNGKTDLSNYAALLDEKERERSNIIDEKNKCYYKSKIGINLLKDEDERQVLLARYHFDLGWSAISRGMNKSVRRVLQIHGQALKKFRLEDG